MNNINPAKQASPDHPILDVLADRYSPYLYDPRPVEREKLLACLEAARWAASSFNEQPWTFFVAPREDQPAFQKMLACLVEANQAWAQHAGVLMLTAVKRTFSRNDKPNRVAEHDLGLAAGNLSAQAQSLGLSVHQMAGIEIPKIRQAYSIPDGYDPVTAIALGYAASPDGAQDEELAKRDRAPRTRKPLAEFVFGQGWGAASDLL